MIIKNKKESLLPTSNLMILGLQQRKQQKLGFAKVQSPTENSEIINYRGEGHLATIGRTGSRKSRTVVIQNLLNFEGSKVIFDIKGELYLTISRYHNEQNYNVILIYPVHFLTDEPDCFNPLDLINFVSTPKYDANDF
ncbi:MAG TPA: type IV secretory system conjugative DNA transfer family protein [Pyrinomonadaceae bacterium]|nr:type IV secretory system conjugative DNA transfer family protein [Pyrinomonadaceae bacterium]